MNLLLALLGSVWIFILGGHTAPVGGDYNAHPQFRNELQEQPIRTSFIPADEETVFGELQDLPIWHSIATHYVGDMDHSHLSEIDTAPDSPSAAIVNEARQSGEEHVDQARTSTTERQSQEAASQEDPQTATQVASLSASSPPRESENRKKYMPHAPRKLSRKKFSDGTSMPQLVAKARMVNKMIEENHDGYHYFIFPSGVSRSLPAHTAARYKEFIDDYLKSWGPLPYHSKLLKVDQALNIIKYREDAALREKKCQAQRERYHRRLGHSPKRASPSNAATASPTQTSSAPLPSPPLQISSLNLSPLPPPCSPPWSSSPPTAPLYQYPDIPNHSASRDTHTLHAVHTASTLPTVEHRDVTEEQWFRELLNDHGMGTPPLALFSPPAQHISTPSFYPHDDYEPASSSSTPSSRSSDGGDVAKETWFRDLLEEQTSSTQPYLPFSPANHYGALTTPQVDECSDRYLSPIQEPSHHNASFFHLPYHGEQQVSEQISRSFQHESLSNETFNQAQANTWWHGAHDATSHSFSSRPRSPDQSLARPISDALRESHFGREETSRPAEEHLPERRHSTQLPAIMREQFEETDFESDDAIPLRLDGRGNPKKKSDVHQKLLQEAIRGNTVVQRDVGRRRYYVSAEDVTTGIPVEVAERKAEKVKQLIEKYQRSTSLSRSLDLRHGLYRLKKFKREKPGRPRRIEMDSEDQEAARPAENQKDGGLEVTAGGDRTAKEMKVLLKVAAQKFKLREEEARRLSPIEVQMFNMQWKNLSPKKHKHRLRLAIAFLNARNGSTLMLPNPYIGRDRPYSESIRPNLSESNEVSSEGENCNNADDSNCRKRMREDRDSSTLSQPPPTTQRKRPKQIIKVKVKDGTDGRRYYEMPSTQQRSMPIWAAELFAQEIISSIQDFELGAITEANFVRRLTKYREKAASIISQPSRQRQDQKWPEKPRELISQTVPSHSPTVTATSTSLLPGQNDPSPVHTYNSV